MKTRQRDRRENAQQLLAQRASRTDAQQLARLDKMFGAGKGAKRERARLVARSRKMGE